MAIAAIDAELSRVVPVTEWHWLLARNVLVGVPRRQRDRIKRVSQPANDQHGAIDRHPRDEVRAVMKNLWHRSLIFECLPTSLALSPFRAPASALPRSKSWARSAGTDRTASGTVRSCRRTSPSPTAWDSTCPTSTADIRGASCPR